ncbi:MAG: SMC-Scp complex subunit ScpB [Acidobacteria bacterium]|nr:SMC-Scp complex subunit ScpB [Acidobacteriota bacterium]
MEKENLKPILDALIFVADEPLALDQLRELFPDQDPAFLKGCAEELMREFNAFHKGIEMRQVAGGFKVATRPEHHEWVREYLKLKPSAKLSLAALETLAVIAYKQPVTLAEILQIRGVKSSSSIKTLLDKKLIETRGRKKVVGRPILYGTSREFLNHFGLKDLSELPTLQEFAELIHEGSDGSPDGGAGLPHAAEDPLP